MTCLFPLNSETYWGARRSTWEERESYENASSYAERRWLRSGPFLFEGPSIFSALSRAAVVHIWKTWFKFGCELPHWFIVLRQNYFKKVVEQCVVILAITWLDFKILISTSYFQPGEILIGTDARLQRRFPLKSNRKEKKTAKNLSQINNQIVQSLLNSLPNSLPNLVLDSVVSLTPHTFTNAAQPFMLC